MKRVLLMLILCFLPIFLISCVTIKEFTNRLGTFVESKTAQKPANAEQKIEWDYGKLVFMGGECVAWFGPDSNIIGHKDLEEYFQKNNIEPEETKVLAHFTFSLDWAVVEKTQTNEYTTEYKLKREKIKK